MPKHSFWILLAALLLAAVAGGIYYRRHRIEEGREAFLRLGCNVCHGSGSAPPLTHVGRKYDRRFFVEWLTNPQRVYRRLGRMPLNPGFSPMPRQAASPGDIDLLSYYLASKR
jgi:cbb3-type cytochrome oxidase cytochrome c subunit